MDFFKNIFTSLTTIKLPGGMVGKICVVLLVATVSMAIIACALGVVWIGTLAIVLIFILCFSILWRIISFAQKNPQAALLDGAHFVAHTKLMLGTKANPQLPSMPQDYIEGHPVSLEPERTKQLGQSDEADLQKNKNGGT